jgi:hypothetical protein
MVPYRDSAVGKPATFPPGELTYVPAERKDQQSGLARVVNVVGIPAAVGAVLWRFVGEEAALGGLALALAVAVWMWHRRPKDGANLRVEDGELRVCPLGSTEPTWRVPIGDLEDVVLETKTVERVVEGGNVNLGATYLNPRIAPPTDTNRIVLQGLGGSSVPLSATYLGHSDTLEWFGKIRVFLRKYGWTPKSEREPDSQRDGPESAL